MITTLRSQAKVDLLRQATSGESPSPALLFDLAAALAETGEASEAADVFQRAYRLQPWTCPLLCVNESPTPPEIAMMRDQAAMLINHNIAYSGVIAALAVAEAHSGNRDAVERLVDYDRFFRSDMMMPPEGLDQAAFTSALAAEIRTDLEYHDQPANRAIRRAWRRSVTMKTAGPAAKAWLKGVRGEIDRYMAALPRDSDHPFLVSRPASYKIGAWAVVSNGDSFHMPHMHPSAWLSGVFYVVCPKVARAPGSRRGWLSVEPPAMHGVSGEMGWGGRMIAPEPGTLVLMPSYFFHGTQPMGVEEERICIAFDVLPEELAPQDLDAGNY